MAELPLVPSAALYGEEQKAERETHGPSALAASGRELQTGNLLVSDVEIISCHLLVNIYVGCLRKMLMYV